MNIFEARTLFRESNDKRDPIALATAILYGDSIKTREALILQLIGAVAQHYAPKIKPIKRQTDRAWVASAMSKDETRPHICGVYVRDGWAHATDGHRIHSARADLRDGWIDPKTWEPIAKTDTFPPVDQCVPSDACTEPLGLSDFTGHTLTPFEETWALHLPGGAKMCFNAKYIVQAFGAMPLLYAPAPEKLGPLDPLKLESHNGKMRAVIMPRRP